MNAFILFLNTHWLSVATVAVILIIMAVLAKLGYTKYVKQMSFYFVVKAEQLLGNGTGELKYATVVNWVYDKLPLLIRLLFSKKQIDTYIEDSVQKMKKMFAENPEVEQSVLNPPIISNELISAKGFTHENF